MPNQAGIDDHTNHAEELAAGYATIDRAKIYPAAFVESLNGAHEPLDILDIGAGAGNNAYFLARKGHHVTAIEPSGLLDIARRDHAHPGIDYLDDRLPALATQHRKYDVILLDSVLHYIDPAERTASLRRIAELLKPKGKLVVIYPTPPTREHQFELSPELFRQELASANAILPKPQQLAIIGEPSVTRDMRQRKGLNGKDVHYCKFLIESVGLAQSIPRRGDRGIA